MRDTRLPQVNNDYVKEVLSSSNLAGSAGLPAAIPESLIDLQHRSLREFETTQSGF